jgi:hypothetical protein
MQKYIIIKADCNDADYVTKMSPISDEGIGFILPVIEAIKTTNINNNHDHKQRNNWGTGDVGDRDSYTQRYVETGILTQEQADTFDEYVPYGDENYPGVHTIESIQIINIIEELL